MRRLALGPFVLLGWLLAAAEAPAAAPPPVGYRLEWNVPAELGCGSAEQFVQRVQQRGLVAPFSPTAPTSVEIQIVRAARWELVVRLRDEAGSSTAERRVVSSDSNCAGILAGATLAVELLLSAATDPQLTSPEPAKPDPTAPEASSVVAAGAEQPPAEPATQAPTAPSAPNSSPQRRARPAPREPLAALERVPSMAPPVATAGPLELAIMGASYLWVLPSPTLGAQLSAGYAVVPRWTLAVELGLSQDWSGSQTLEEQTIELNLALRHLGLGLNRELYRSPRWSHRLGLRAYGGLLTPTVQGATALRRSPVLWAALGPRAETRLELGWGLGLNAAGTLVIPVTRDRFTEEGGALLAQVPPVGGLVATGISASW